MPASELSLLLFLLLVVPVFTILLAYLLFKTFAWLYSAIFKSPTVFLANKYLFNRKHRGAINIINGISVFGITYACMALVIILSIFNGFEHLIKGMYTDFDPDIRVVAAKGKTIPQSDSLAMAMTELEGVEFVSPVILDKAMLTYNDKERMVDLLGVKNEYLKISRLDTLLYEGNFEFKTMDGYDMAVLGGSVAYMINASMGDRVQPMTLWAANDAKKFFQDPENAAKSKNVFTAGYFKVQLEYDTRYIIADFALVQDLFDMEGKVSAYDVLVTAGADGTATSRLEAAFGVAEKLQAKLGPDYKVHTWFDQHETLFNIMKSEKLVAYLILSLILLISAVNIIGGLSMIVVEKLRDIATLMAMGAGKKFIRRVFLTEGIFVGGIGGVAGMISAFIFSLVHINFGVLKINGGDSFQEIEFFPLEMRLQDYLLTFATVFTLSMIAGIYPSAKAAGTNIIVAMRK